MQQRAVPALKASVIKLLLEIRTDCKSVWQRVSALCAATVFCPFCMQIIIFLLSRTTLRHCRVEHWTLPRSERRNACWVYLPYLSAAALPSCSPTTSPSVSLSFVALQSAIEQHIKPNLVPLFPLSSASRSLVAPQTPQSFRTRQGPKRGKGVEGGVQRHGGWWGGLRILTTSF